MIGVELRKEQPGWELNPGQAAYMNGALTTELPGHVPRHSNNRVITTTLPPSQGRSRELT